MEVFSDYAKIYDALYKDKDYKVDVNYDFVIEDKETHFVTRMSELHQMRYYFRPEIEEFLSQEGFELIAHLDDKTLLEPDFSSWSTFFIARAK